MGVSGCLPGARYDAGAVLDAPTVASYRRVRPIVLIGVTSGPRIETLAEVNLRPIGAAGYQLVEPAPCLS